MKPLDPEAQRLIDRLDYSGVPPFAGMPAERIRERMAGLRDAMPPASSVGEVEDFTIPHPEHPVPARRYRYGPDPAPGTILYLHGGGWIGGSLDGSDAVCRELVVTSGCDLVSVGYRLAPENPFPAAVNDVDTALHWMLEGGAPDGPIALVGDSAGGNLAAVAARHARDHSLGSRVALQVLVYPITDCAMDTRSYLENARGLLLNAADMKWFWDLYVPDLVTRIHPDASPARATDLHGLAPALILLTDRDPLHDEGLAYAHSLIDASVEVTIDLYEGMLHGFFPLVGLLGASKRAVKTVGAAIADTVARPSESLQPRALP